MTFQHFLLIYLFLNLWKLPEVFSSLWNYSENVGKFSKWSSDNFWKSSEVFRKLFWVYQRFTENFFITFQLWHLWTEDQIQEFWFVICTGITHFALVLLINCTTLSQSESSPYKIILIKSSVKTTCILHKNTYCKKWYPKFWNSIKSPHPTPSGSTLLPFQKTWHLSTCRNRRWSSMPGDKALAATSDGQAPQCHQLALEQNFWKKNTQNVVKSKVSLCQDI